MQVSAGVDSTKNNIHEPIYENVNNRKQTNPVLVFEFYDFELYFITETRSRTAKDLSEP